MRYMTRTLLTSSSLLVFVVVAVAGFGELSKRHACESSDKFLGPSIVKQLPYMKSWLSMWGLRTRDEGTAGPRWIVRYGGAVADPGVEVEVSLFGEVTGCNVRQLRALIGSPLEERTKLRDAFIIEKTGASARQ